MTDTRGSSARDLADGEELLPLALLRSLARTVSWFGAYPRTIVVVAAAVLLEMAFVASIPLATRALIDRALIPRDAALLVRITAFLAGGALTISLIGFLGDYYFARMVTGVLRDLRVRLLDHLQRLSTSHFTANAGADISAHFSTDLGAVKSALEIFISWGVLPAIDIVANVVLLFVLDVRLAIIAQLAWPVSLIGPRILARRVSRAAADLKAREAGVLAEVREVASGAEVIRAFGLEETITDRFRFRVGALRRLEMLGHSLSLSINRSVGGGLLVLQGLLLGVGGLFVFRRECTVGTLVAFQGLFMSLTYSIGYVVRFLDTHVHAAAGLARIERLFAEPFAIEDPPSASPLPAFSAELTFDHVAFAYGPGRPALADVSFSIRRGERIAIVGATGSGKSTLLSLLLRFREPTSGTFEMDGRDVRSATRRSLTDQVGVVFQETFLFDSTIRENIRCGRSDATEQEIIEAARHAELHDLIERLPEGYDTRVGERGASLSGGQRQRLAIARALLRDPAILLLDEATSALDPVTETIVNRALGHARRCRTVITVTHRLGSIVDADRIFVLEKGRIVEQGRHADLLARRGAYARLWTAQSGSRAVAATREPTPTRLDRLGSA